MADNVQRRKTYDATIEQSVMQSLVAQGGLEPGELLIGIVVIAKTERLNENGERILRRHRLHPAGRIDPDLEIGMLRRAARDAELDSD